MNFMALIKKIVLLGLFASCFANPVFAQFWFDAASVSGWHAPAAGSEHPTEWYGIASMAVPLTISEQQKIIVGGYYEHRQLKYDFEKVSLTVQGIGVPITWLMQSKDTSIVFTATFIGRLNGEKISSLENTFQAGGAVLANFRVNSRLRLKAGYYFNNEFFSDYWVPLAGIEWRINDRNLISGTFPNSARFEHRFNDSFYMGMAYKSITNSYRLSEESGYLKVMDNHLGIFADYYFTKNLVGMLEAGHTFMRELKIRNQGYTLTKNENGFFVNAGIFFRIRLNEKN